jgi:hypothetical protein
MGFSWNLGQGAVGAKNLNIPELCLLFIASFVSFFLFDVLNYA